MTRDPRPPLLKRPHLLAIEDISPLEAIALLMVVTVLFLLAIFAASILTRTEPNLLYTVFGAVVGFVTAASIYQGQLDDERARHKAELEWAEENLKKAQLLFGSGNRKAAA